MNILATLTPDEATAAFKGWLDFTVGAIVSLSVAAAVVLPKLAALKAQVEALFVLHGQTAQNLTTLAIATPPPVPVAAPEATAAIEANTAATVANTDAQLSTEPVSPHGQ